MAIQKAVYSKSAKFSPTQKQAYNVIALHEAVMLQRDRLACTSLQHGINKM